VVQLLYSYPHELRLVSTLRFKLGRSLIKLICSETLIRYRVEIELNSIMKDQALIKFNER